MGTIPDTTKSIVCFWERNDRDWWENSLRVKKNRGKRRNENFVWENHSVKRKQKILKKWVMTLVKSLQYRLHDSYQSWSSFPHYWEASLEGLANVTHLWTENLSNFLKKESLRNYWTIIFGWSIFDIIRRSCEQDEKKIWTVLALG